ncbi:MAG: DUF6980 family protein [Clostridia bacterium]
MSLYCCRRMEENVNQTCKEHSNMFECLEQIITYNRKFNEYGIIIHDGGKSYLLIEYCPWCGAKLPQSKRKLWFEQLYKLEYKNPLEENMPEEFQTDKWWRKDKS